MKAKGIAFNSDDCFAKFDEVFAKLEADLAAPSQTGSVEQPLGDLSEFEAAFDSIDRQLGAHAEPVETSPPTTPSATIPVGTPAPPACPPPASTLASREPAADQTPKPARVSLAVVPPSARAEHDAPRTTALACQPPEELWQRPSSGGTPLERLVGTMQNLAALQRSMDPRRLRISDPARWLQVTNVFAEARELCADFDLPTARVRAEFTIAALEEDRLDTLRAEVTELLRHLRHDLKACSIAPIARERVWGFTLALEDRTRQAFPSAVNDVADAGRCIGFGLHAAAAFHLLRAADRGRRVLARAVRFSEQDAEAMDWTTTITALQMRMIDLAGWPAGPARKALKDFLTALLSDAREMEAAHRRLVEGEMFLECHAESVWHATRDFLTLAAERVSESEDTLLTADHFIPRS